MMQAARHGRLHNTEAGCQLMSVAAGRNPLLESVGMIAWQCLPELRQRALRRRIRGHVVMEDSSPPP
jgi:hypothetical protein